MSISTKILIFLGAALAIGALVFILIKQFEISARQKSIETEVVAQKQLADDIIRAQAGWATKADIDKMGKENGIDLNVIKDDLSKMGARIDGINVVTINTTGINESNVHSTTVTPGIVDGGAPPLTIVKCPGGPTVPCPDPFGYQHYTQHLKLDEKFGSNTVPFGSVGFEAWHANPFSLQVYPRQYSLTTVTGKDDQQRDYVYNKFSITADGKRYDVKINDSKYLQEYPEAKFSWWNPRIYMVASVGIGLPAHIDFVPSLSIAMMSYGKYVNQPSWTFLSPGVGYAVDSKKVTFTINPFSYDVAQHLPLVKNLYIGPTVGLDTSSNWYLLGSLSVGL